MRKEISVIRKKYGKKQTSQTYEFLKYSGQSRNPYNSQNMKCFDVNQLFLYNS